jgi:Ca-activated chloride channel family protein
VGYTNIGAGIDLGREVLNGPAARPLAAKTMVVLTDGIWNRGRDPVLAAQEAANDNIAIHTVTFSSGANISDMRRVAEIGGGQHYHAPDEAALRAAFREIARTLPVVISD